MKCPNCGNPLFKLTKRVTKADPSPAQGECPKGTGCGKTITFTETKFPEKAKIIRVENTPAHKH